MFLWEHPPARTYVSGPIYVMGDIVHATTPCQGSGKGMAIEDSLILSTLIGRAKSVPQAKPALEAYVTVRRERTQVVELSHKTGIIRTDRSKEIGLHFEKFR